MNKSFNTIVVSGKSNVGKTSAIKEFVGMALKLKETKLLEQIPEKHDYWFKFSINNKVVGVITFGDSAKAISKAFKYLGKCDYYVCASHLYGETVNTVQNLKGIINPLFINKIGINKNNDCSQESFDEDNKRFSNQLLVLFKYMIKAC